MLRGSNGPWWVRYLDFLDRNTVEADKLRWIEESEITDVLMTILNATMHVNPRIQEAIIKKRPDLIGKIWNLDRFLANKYRHEAEISKVDL